MSTLNDLLNNYKLLITVQLTNSFSYFYSVIMQSWNQVYDLFD